MSTFMMTRQNTRAEKAVNRPAVLTATEHTVLDHSIREMIAKRNLTILLLRILSNSNNQTFNQMCSEISLLESIVGFDPNIEGGVAT